MKSDMTTLYEPPYLYKADYSYVLSHDYICAYELGLDILHDPKNVYIGVVRLFKTTQLLKMYNCMVGVKRWLLSSDIWEGI